MNRILLIEPDYKNKYPPLGLMKISTYHKQKGDEVIFFKGKSNYLRNQIWDRIYISTLFTFHWAKTINTIKYYSRSVEKPSNIFIGGVMATLLYLDIKKEVNVTVVTGLLNKKGKLGYSDDDQIDYLVPDYSIIDPNKNPYLKYSYPTSDSYIAYATRGCIRKCDFCAVPIIEPIFMNSLSIAQQVNSINRNFGEKKHLLLLDNNILACKEFKDIITEIKDINFGKNAKIKMKINGRMKLTKRYVDFNQGIDARLLTEEKMKLLSEIAISPLRIAFDDIKYKDLYIRKVKMAADFGIKTLSNYILFNYDDTPDDFYERLKINIELNEEFEKKGLNSQIWSFPMKYSPIKGENCKNRKHVGKNWNKKYLRGIQCILLATHGVVGPRRQFFESAYGKNVNEFFKILMLPENFIIFRNEQLKNGNRTKLNKIINSMNINQKDKFCEIVLENDFKNIEEKTDDGLLLNALRYYSIKRK